jgi:AraC-like DNA-binding protein
MARPGEAASSFRFSTDELDAGSRNRAIEKLYEKKLLPTKIQPLAGAPARVDIVRRSMPGLGILSGALDGVRQEGTPDRDGNGALFLAINLRGVASAYQRGREVALQEGEAVLLTREDTGWSLMRPRATSFIGLMVPRTVLTPMLRNIDDAVLRPIAKETGSLKLLTRYLDVLSDDEMPADVGSRQAITTHVYDLIALSIDAAANIDGVTHGRGVRAARLRAIKQDITAHLDDGGLTPAKVAERHGLTLRYLQKLFETEGVSYSEFLLGQRLAKAYRLLTSSLHAQRSIANIAYGVGFNDLSYFNRVFRRQFGGTPSDIRSR